MSSCDSTPFEDQHGDYARIERAIGFIRENRLSQPSLDEIAAAVGMSRSHLQRTFTRWAGVSPKKFLQSLTLDHARTMLGEGASVLDAALECGLSGPGRLHDLFVTFEAMTPGQYRWGGAGLTIWHRLIESPFGPMLAAATETGICHLAFYEDASADFTKLCERFPAAEIQAGSTGHHAAAANAVAGLGGSVALHVIGTPFQLKVWECLVSIPAGRLATYAQIAEAIGQPAASRAVGSAIGRNRLALLIPCHRVIRGDGGIGGYAWGTSRKQAVIAWESARTGA